MQTPIVSLDFGNVIAVRDGHGNPLLEMPEAPGLRAGISRLADLFGWGNIHVTSRCTEPKEAEIVQWLRNHNIVADGRMPVANVRFCRERHEKAPILSRIEASAHVDDRPDVLVPTAGIPSLRCRVLFNPAKEDLSLPGLGALDGLIICVGWHELPEILKAELLKTV